MATTMYFLHVLLAFIAIAFLVIPGLILEKVAKTRDAVLIKRMYPLAIFHGQIGGPVALLTAIAGFAVAWQFGIPLSSGWLIAAYIAFIVVMALGIGYHARRETRIASLAKACPTDMPSPELLTTIDDAMAMPMLWISGLLWTIIIWLMVAKPF